MVIIRCIRSQFLANIGRSFFNAHLQSNKRNILLNSNIGIQIFPLSTSIVNKNAQVINFI